MLELKDWLVTNSFAKGSFANKPWLILGKGPGYAKFADLKQDDYNLLSLDHVVHEVKVSIAHFIDIDAIETCGPALLEHCEWLIMPRYPHVSGCPSEILTLEDWKNNIPILNELDKRGKLVCYDLMLGQEALGPNEIALHYHSAEAALGILAKIGAKQISSLGTNESNLQFKKLEEIADLDKLDYQPLIEPMRVFVGADESQMLAALVLEYSIHKFTSKPVRVEHMVNLPMPLPKDEKNHPRTGFSFFRFAIPQLAHYQGRALYVDSDMLVFADLAELWDIEFGKQKILCTTQDVPDAWKDNPWFHPGRQFAVMLMDCGRLKWTPEEVIQGLDEDKYSYAQLLFDFCLVEADEIEDRIPPAWNCLEHYEEGNSKLLHYTVIPTQPWTYDAHPLGYLWEKAFCEAVQNGWISRTLIEEHLARGWLRKSLAYVADLAPNQGKYSGIISMETPDIGNSARLQRLVKEWRAAISEAKSLERQLHQAKAELQDMSNRLTATHTLESEYRERIEQVRHSLYSSSTWKLGRLFTKPVELLRKR